MGGGVQFIFDLIINFSEPNYLILLTMVKAKSAYEPSGRFANIAPFTRVSHSVYLTRPQSINRLGLELTF